MSANNRGKPCLQQTEPDDACPFLDLDAASCREVRVAEERQRSLIRCADERHTSCFFFFVHGNARLDQQARERNPERYHARPGRILAMPGPYRARPLFDADVDDDATAPEAAEAAEAADDMRDAG